LPTCLITGAAGFLAQHVARAFASSGFDLVGLDANPAKHPVLFERYIQGRCENVDFAALARELSPSVVCHLAGPASVAKSVADPYSDFMQLLPGTTRVLSGLSTLPTPPRFILFSSAAVYGDPSVLPVDESAEIKPISPYGIHKALAEDVLAQYARLYSFPAVALRIFSAYGAGLRRQVVWDIAERASAATLAGKPTIAMSGTGMETRDFVHGDDVAQAALMAASAPLMSGSTVINVASGRETTISALASLVIEALGLPVDVVFTREVRPGDPSSWQADVSKLRSMGWSPRVELSAGVQQTVSQWRGNVLMGRDTDRQT
jgi:UDP-glucose 4-epimerase